MNDYISECINLYSDELTGVSPTPAKGDLFEEDNEENAAPLFEDRADKCTITQQPSCYM